MNPRTRKSFLALLRGAWDATIDERPRLLLFIVMFIVACTLDLLSPWATGYVLGKFVELGATPEAFY